MHQVLWFCVFQVIDATRGCALCLAKGVPYVWWALRKKRKRKRVEVAPCARTTIAMHRASAARWRWMSMTRMTSRSNCVLAPAPAEKKSILAVSESFVRPDARNECTAARAGEGIFGETFFFPDGEMHPFDACQSQCIRDVLCLCGCVRFRYRTIYCLCGRASGSTFQGWCTCSCQYLSVEFPIESFVFEGCILHQRRTILRVLTEF